MMALPQPPRHDQQSTSKRKPCFSATHTRVKTPLDLLVHQTYQSAPDPEEIVRKEAQRVKVGESLKKRRTKKMQWWMQPTITSFITIRALLRVICMVAKNASRRGHKENEVNHFTTTEKLP